MHLKTFFQGVIPVALAATISCVDHTKPAQSPAQVISIVGEVKEEKKEEDNNLTELVRELSKYDVVHFGEAHPPWHPHEQLAGLIKETSTLEDFTELFLPLFKDADIVGKPYEIIRTEAIPYEFGLGGERFISKMELDYLDMQNFMDIPPLSRKHTPTLYEEMILFGGLRDPRGTVKLIRKGGKLNYKIRGVYISKEERQIIRTSISEVSKKNNIPQEQVEYIDFISFVKILDENYLTAIRKDLKHGEERLLIYGGALHNDSVDGNGIGKTMRKEFPGRYAAVDIVKVSVNDSFYFTEYNYLLRAEGKDPNYLENPEWLKLKDDPNADYAVFLPSTVKKE